MTFRRQQQFQRVTFVLLAVAIVVIAWQVNSSRNLSKENRDLIERVRVLALDGKQAHDSLCALKADLRQRVKDSEKFLTEHPHGIAGIPASVIANSIKGQRATLKALRLPCPTDPPPS